MHPHLSSLEELSPNTPKSGSLHPFVKINPFQIASNHSTKSKGDHSKYGGAIKMTSPNNLFFLIIKVVPFDQFL